MQLAGPPHDLLVGRMAANHRNLDGDRLVGAGRDHGALADLLRAGLPLGPGRPLAGLASLRAPSGSVAPPARRPDAPALGALACTLLGRSLGTGRGGRPRALALATLLGRQD